MTDPRPRAIPHGSAVLGLLVLWLLLYFGVRLYLEANPDLGRGVRLALAFVPTPVFAAFLWRFIQGVRSADELERRIQLEALAVAFPLGVLMLTTLGLEFGSLLGGAVVVESVFSLPGIGRLTVDAIKGRDLPLIQGTILFVAVVFSLVNLIVDLGYAGLDPRIRYD